MARVQFPCASTARVALGCQISAADRPESPDDTPKDGLGFFDETTCHHSGLNDLTILSVTGPSRANTVLAFQAVAKGCGFCDDSDHLHPVIYLTT